MSALPDFGGASARTIEACMRSVTDQLAAEPCHRHPGCDCIVGCAAAPFRPFTGYDPLDGDDPRVVLSRGNPCLTDAVHYGAEATALVARRVAEIAEQIAEQEEQFDVANLAGETILSVEPAPGGWRIRCGSGSVIHVERGHTFDAAGLRVIEP